MLPSRPFSPRHRLVLPPTFAQFLEGRSPRERAEADGVESPPPPALDSAEEVTPIRPPPPTARESVPFSLVPDAAPTLPTAVEAGADPDSPSPAQTLESFPPVSMSTADGSAETESALAPEVPSGQPLETAQSGKPRAIAPLAFAVVMAVCLSLVGVKAATDGTPLSRLRATPASAPERPAPADSASAPASAQPASPLSGERQTQSLAQGRAEGRVQAN